MMRIDDMTPSRRYLAEWYLGHLGGRAINDVAQCIRTTLASTTPVDSRPAELLYALEVSQDDYAFGVFVAVSAEFVTKACQRAGLPADRVTAAFEANDRPTT